MGLIGMEDEPQRVEVYNPWHYRTRVSPARTYCGRIIYNKPTHSFLISDVERIFRKITPPYQPGEEVPLTFFSWFRRMLDNLWAIVSYSAFGMPSFPEGTIFELMTWVVSQRWQQALDPLEAMRTRVFLAIVYLIDFYDLGSRIAQRYKGR